MKRGAAAMLIALGTAGCLNGRTPLVSPAARDAGAGMDAAARRADGSTLPDARMTDEPPVRPPDAAVDQPREAGAESRDTARAAGDARDGAGVDGGPDGGRDGSPDAARVLAFRPLLPLSTSIVTSRLPTFAWTDFDLAEYFILDLCGDPACDGPVRSVASGLPSITIDMELPAGVTFWRVRARLVGGGTASTAIWEVFAGQRSAPNDTAMLALPDFDRDGRNDVAQAAERGPVQVSYFGPGGRPRAPPTTLAGAAPALALAHAVDVDGDGFGDLLVGRQGAVDLHRGGPDGLGAAASLGGPAGFPSFGGSVAGAGDVNGDGFGDVVVGAPAPDGAGAGWLFLGGARGLAPQPAGAALPAGRVAAAGDVNADGYADVVVCAPALHRAVLYLGFSGGLQPTGVALEDPRPAAGGTSSFGNACAGVGDVDGDGFGDVAVTGADTDLIAFVYHGGPLGIARVPAADAVPLRAGSAAGRSADELRVVSAGDVDGDGYTDLLLAGPEGLALFLGGSGGVASTARSTLPGARCAAAGVGDLDGDGHADVVAAPAGCGDLVAVHGGGADGLSLMPSYTFPAVDFPLCPRPLLAR